MQDLGILRNGVISMSMFLSKLELSEFTGAKQLEKQRKWLSDHGYLYDIKVDGTLIVLRSHIEKKLGGDVVRMRKSQPNEKALLLVMGR